MLNADSSTEKSDSDDHSSSPRPIAPSVAAFLRISCTAVTIWPNERDGKMFCSSRTR